MIIMAIDHTRDFFHAPALIADPLNPATTTLPIYFTRWITHFCAPVFLFLSGISAYLASRKRTKAEASLFLIKRGVWLVLVELVLITLAITFNPSYNYFILQVIWAIGWSMIILGILTRFSFNVVLIAGIILFFGHNIVDYVSPDPTQQPVALKMLLTARNSFIPLDATHVLADFYAILPWTGVMLMGYCVGTWFNKDFPAAQRKKLLISTGTGLIALFIILRFTGIYGNPEKWQKGNDFLGSLYNFLNTSKYPPSLQYLSMTLGPACLVLALIENWKNKFSDIISVYGKVPFFYYILHFYLIHIITVILFYATGHNNTQIVDPNAPIFYFRPLNFGWGLPVVYLIWFGIITLLYFPCKWFSRYKAEHRQWWLSYV
jgi:uncharacterized membrane protein